MTSHPSTDPQCPACGETDLLQGRLIEGGIDVRCDGCGHTWRRAQRGCATCGDSAVVERDQFLSQNPRGNQTAVVGRRLIRLCPVCDREALTLADRHSGMVEQGYVSRYLIDRRALPALGPRQQPQPTRPASSQRSPLERRAPDPVLRAATSTRAPSTDPTLREAISSFLEGPAERSDSFVMLLIGRELGPATRISTLGPDSADRLFRAGGATAPAAETATRALAYWRSLDWPV